MKINFILTMILLLLVTYLCACADPTESTGTEDTKVANSSTSAEENITTTNASLTEETTTETPENDPIFSVDASLAAIDQLASENLSVSLKYQTKTYDGLKHEFNGGLGQVNGKYWSRVDLDGTAILEEEGGYYHKYTFESSKWRYYDTYPLLRRWVFFCAVRRIFLGNPLKRA